MFSGEGDVFVLLDCCHAVSIAQEKLSQSSRKIELLVATATSRLTPAPGRLSFSSVVIRQLRKVLADQKTVSVVNLHAQLCQLSHQEMTETPVYGDLSSNGEESILLGKFRPPVPQGFRQRPAATLLTVSLSDDLTALEITTWLKRRAPRSISAVKIEALVLKARRAQNLADPSGASYPDLY